MTKFCVYTSSITDPFWNLAMENLLLEKIRPGQKVLFIYQNSPSIVMGRFQNPWLECDLEKIRADGINLVRRQSGGGCVYHDSGNINFCFIQATRDHCKELNNSIIVAALEKLNINAYSSKRSDILVDFEGGTKKISGSAFKQKKDSSFHHATMLIKSDLKNLNQYLTSKHEDIDGKGIKSVKSSVVNLHDLTIDKISPDHFVEQLISCFKEYYQVPLCETVHFNKVTELQDQEYFNFLKSAKWIFGETPYFELDRCGNGINIEVKLKKGLISLFDIYGEQVDPFVSNIINNKLKGVCVYEFDLKHFKNELCLEFSQQSTEISHIMKFIASQRLFID